MKSIALRRLRMLPVPPGTGLSKKQKLAFLAELANMGYTVSRAELLDKCSPAFLLDYNQVVDTLKEIRGGKVKYVPLFLGFPNDVPDDDEYFHKRLVGWFGNLARVFPEGEKLKNGLVVPAWLFELKEFGADPITQFQDEGLFKKALKFLKGKKKDTHTEWISLQLVDAEETLGRLRDWALQCLYANSSVKEALHQDILQVLSTLDFEQELDLDRVVRRENRALLAKLYWQANDVEKLKSVTQSATDILRLFAALTESDISLAEKIQFPKLKRVQRRLILEILESASGLEEDFRNYKGLWKELGRYLHPGEYAKAFPKTAAVFDQLRNGKLRTFASTTERLLVEGEAQKALAHLRKRPGTLGRKLHELLRCFPTQSELCLDEFSKITKDMTLKNLLVLKSYFSTINSNPWRTVINKRGKIKVLPNNSLGALQEDQLRQLESCLLAAIRANLEQRESWQGKTVYVDPRLRDFTIPLQQRAASDGILTYGRGSRIRIDMNKVLRLFVYWKESGARTDLDLSVIQFDENFDYLGHVSYTHLSAAGIVHSGDLQSAPHGAAEFVDITLSAVDQNVRYLAPQVLRYCGDAFTELDCHAGWMVRENVDKSYQSFDIKTVVNKFDLNGSGSYCIPLLVDLKAREATLVDLFIGQKALHNNVEGSKNEVAVTCREVHRFIQTRPTLFTLAHHHAKVRGATLVERDEADISFGIEGCTYNAHETEKILAELL
jgi:stress response protein SCP2